MLYSIYLQEKRDLITGLRARTKAGRPNWDKLFYDLKEQKKGQITVFYCGNASLEKVLQQKSTIFGFKFKTEVF